LSNRKLPPKLIAIMELNNIEWVHAHTVSLVVASFVFFLTLTGLSAVLSPVVWPVAFAKLPATGRLDWHARIVGGIFACCAVYAAFPEYWNPGAAIVADFDFGSTPRSHCTICMAVRKKKRTSLLIPPEGAIKVERNLCGRGTGFSLL